MSRSANPVAVGAFVLGGLILLVGSVVVVGGLDLFAEKDRYSIFFGGSVNGLAVGAPVKLEGVPVGTVVGIRAVAISDASTIDVLTETMIEIDRSQFERRGPPVVGATRIETLIDRGIRAQLNLQSLLTGQLYVALLFRPDTPPTMVDADPRYEEIPTIPTRLEEFEETARGVLERLATVPIEEILADFGSALSGIDDLVTDPAIPRAIQELNSTLAEARAAVGDLRRLVRQVDGQIEPLMSNAMKTLDQTRDSVVAVSGSLETGSPLSYQLSTALQEVSEAARAVKVLANTLEQNPNALVFGKSGRE